MTRDEIDILWQRAMQQAVKDGGQDSDKKEPPTGNGSGNGPSAPK